MQEVQRVHDQAPNPLDFMTDEEKKIYLADQKLAKKYARAQQHQYYDEEADEEEEQLKLAMQASLREEKKQKQKQQRD